MTENNKQLESLNCIDKDWFTNNEPDTALVRIYAPLNMWSEQYEQFHIKELEALNTTPPVWVKSGKGSIKHSVMHDVVTSSTTDQGTLNITINSYSKEADDGYFIALSTPLIIKDDSSSFQDARHRLDITSSTIALHFGKNILPEIFLETTLSALDGSPGNVPQVRRLPRPTDGPFLSVNKWQEITEAISALQALDSRTANRIERSLAIFREALNSEQGYIYYWTALDVLCESNQNGAKIRSKLQRIYRLSSSDEVNNIFGFQKLKDLRNELIHEGVTYEIKGDIERFVQLMFIDILRHELEIPHIAYMQAMMNTTDWDLTSIGINAK